MQKIIDFIIKNKTLLLFLILFSISIGLTIQTHSYHKSKFINSSSTITGEIFNLRSKISQYFNLRKENKILIEELRILKQNEYNTRNTNKQMKPFKDTSYLVKSGSVIKNSYSKKDNYLLINKGKKDSIKTDFGVFNAKGVLGIIDHTTSNFSRVLSILNSKSRINVALKHSNHIGSLVWNGKSYRYAQIEDMSKFAPIKIGDTIITGGQSSIFPKGILIGTVTSFKTANNEDSYDIEIVLCNDMSNLGHVYIIEKSNKKEIDSLLIDLNEEWNVK